MAFRKKDVKKASYYVWFLGSVEAKGLRGDDYVVPALRCLIEKEKELEPSKVTLQVSNKGIKIIQNVPKKLNKSGHWNSLEMTGKDPRNVPAKTELIKHFIPHHAITCVTRQEDIVCCILLIYNPITKCPVHVHGYRCDSVETATSLRYQLQALIDRPENQKKFEEIEYRLADKGLIPSLRRYQQSSPPLINRFLRKSKSPLGPSTSDGRSTRTDGSDRTSNSFGSSTDLHSNESPKHDQDFMPQDNAKVANLYDSLAAELKAKLGNVKIGPILLPPKDYDTISRKQGKLNGIEYRKSTNSQIVGTVSDKILFQKPGSESSGNSSGIGSEEALPAINEINSVSYYKDDYCSSGERWSQSGMWPHLSSSNSLKIPPRHSHVPSPIGPKYEQTKRVDSNKSRIQDKPRFYFAYPELETNVQNNSLKPCQSYYNQETKLSKLSSNEFDDEIAYKDLLSPEPFRLRYLRDTDAKFNNREEGSNRKKHILEYFEGPPRRISLK